MIKTIYVPVKLLCFAVILFSTTVTAFSQAAVITEMSGKVEVQAPRGAWIAARPYMTLAPGTTISTGFRAQAVIKLDEATLYVKQLTRLTIEQIARQQNEIKTGLYIRTGTMEAEVNRDNNKKFTHDFKVRSPVSTAAVRGTKFKYNGNELSVIEGKVTLFNLLQQPTTVFAGDIAKSSNGTDLVPGKLMRGLRFRIRFKLNRFLNRLILDSKISSFLQDSSIVVFYLDWNAVG